MTDQTPAVNEGDYRVRPAEYITVLTLLGLMLVVNLFSFNLYPTVWMDEVLWSEPAINLVRTGHFTTSVWQLQPAGAFWAAHSPLYCFMLSCWLPFTGNSLLAARSFNFVLISLSTFLVWFGTWKYRLIGKPWLRVLVVPLILLGYGISFPYRSARPDIAGLVCLIGFGLSMCARKGWLRTTLVILFSLVAPWIGPQVGLFVGLVTGGAWLLFRNVTFKETLIIGTALFIGGMSMLLFYQLHGVLGDFKATLSQATHEHIYWGHSSGYLGSVPRRLISTFRSYIDDYSAVMLLAGVIVLWLIAFQGGDKKMRRPVVFLLGVFFGIPLMFSFTAHFASYYCYMIYVPLVLAFLIQFGSSYQTAAPRTKKFLMLAFAGATAAAILVGLPMRLTLASSLCEIVPRSEYAKIIQSHIRPDDVIFADYESFFEAKEVAQTVFAPSYSKQFVDLSVQSHDFSDEEKKRINVIIIPVKDSERLKQYFGGKWEAASEPFGNSYSLGKWAKLPVVGHKIEHYFNNPQVVRYQLQVWRRPKE